MVGVGAGHSLGQFATAALQDDPREAKRYLEKGLQAAFTTLPYGIEAHEEWKKKQIPSGATSTGSPVHIPKGSMSLGSTPTTDSQFGMTGSFPVNQFHSLGDPSSFTPNPLFMVSPGSAPTPTAPWSPLFGPAPNHNLSPQAQNKLFAYDVANARVTDMPTDWSQNFDYENRYPQ